MANVERLTLLEADDACTAKRSVFLRAQNKAAELTNSDCLISRELHLNIAVCFLVESTSVVRAKGPQACRSGLARQVDILKRCAMGCVLTFPGAGATFEPSDLAAMGQAYDTIYTTLQLHRGPDALRQTIAAEIIAIATFGKFNTEYMVETILKRAARGDYVFTGMEHCPS